MIKNLAKAISLVFHPLWMPLLGTYILLSGTLLAILPYESKRLIYIIILTSTIGLPLAMLPFLYFRKKFKTLEMTERQERFVPLFIMSIFYFFSYYTLNNLNAPVLLTGYMLGAFVATILSAIINIWWKISLHLTGIGGITALLIIIIIFKQGYPENLFFQVVLFAGIVASARLQLNEHNIGQIIAGYIFGFLSVFITFLIFR